MTSPQDIFSRDDQTSLTEAEGKALLTDLGLTVPASRTVEDSASAVAAAEEIGYPVVLKIASPAVSHKSEWAGGIGVVVGLTTPEDVRTTATQQLRAANERGIEANVLVESAVDLDAGIECIVGGIRDPSFGPVVMVGLGGIFTEVFDDTAHRLAPIDSTVAEQMIAELDAYALLSGIRGEEPRSIASLVDVIVTVSDLLDTYPQIAEIDLNPVLVTAEDAIELDALIALSEE